MGVEENMICRAVPFEGNDSYIFVSYCHADKEILYPYFEQMVQDGYRMWYDDGNHPGDDWLDNIENHLENCKVVLAFISGNSSLSHNCKSEIVYALKCKKKIIPVLIDSADLPKGLRMQLSHLHYLKCSDYSSAQALLGKVYEAEECAACKAPAGTLKLKAVPAVGADVQTAQTQKDCVSFWTANRPVQTDGNVSGTQSAGGDKAPEVPTVKKKKVSVLVKTGKKASEKTAVSESQTEDTENNVSEEKPEKQPVHTQSASVVNELSSNKVLLNHSETAIIQDDEEKTELVGGNLDDGPVTERYDSKMQALLLHITAQRVHILSKPQIRIGRSPIKCDIALEDNPSISKMHAEIIHYNNKFFIHDANSTNGTFVNGSRLNADSQTELDNPAFFQLHEERFLLLTGSLAGKYIGQTELSFLMTENGTGFRLLDSDITPLNRNNAWPDGTLSQDYKIHRAAHALLKREPDGIYLVDAGPEKGNGTYLNGVRMATGDSRILSNGDHIRIGDTTLEFVSITI